VVYEAERAEDGQRVAIKVARPDQPMATVRLLYEADALRAVGPPWVPRVHDSGQRPDGLAYLVMDFVELPTLAQVLAQGTAPMTVGSFVPRAAALLDALAAVHDRGFVHRDLKPENIFIDESALRVVLLDFGIAKLLDSASAPQLTAVGTLLGTPEYMAPEQIRGAAIDKRTDIYALGVILYEMLTARVPFWGNSADVQQGHLARRPALPSDLAPLPRALEELLLRCLAKDPDQRFADTAALRAELLSACAAGQPVTMAAPRAAPSPADAPQVEERAMALLLLPAQIDLAVVTAELNPLGGELVQATGGRPYIIAFGHESGQNPAVRALQGAATLLSRNLTDRAVVDVAPVTIRTRPGGRRRHNSPAFNDPSRFPRQEDEPGVLVTADAAEQLRDLVACEPSDRPRLLRPQSGTGEANGPVTMLRAPTEDLIGRDSLLAELVEQAAQCTGVRRPGIATVIAEPGHGKSRLCVALLAALRAQVSQASLLYLRGRGANHGDADQTLCELLRKVLDLPEAAPEDKGRTLIMQTLEEEVGGAVWASVALALGWLAPEAPEVRAMAAAPGTLRNAAARALGLGLRRRAAATPLLLVLDDAQFADDATLAGLELATLAEGAAPIWVCVLARPAFESMRPSWGQRAAVHQRTVLGPLDAQDAAQLCRALLHPAENVPAAAIERLVARTHGIPLLLVELVRGLKRDGLVRQRNRTDSWYLATDELDRLPDLPLVQWLAGHELAALPRELAAHARLAALLGGEFSTAEVVGVLRELDRDATAAEFPLDGAVGLERLVAVGLLVPHRRGRLGFRHELIRESIYMSIPPAQRAQLHGAAYRYYSAAGLPDELRIPRLAVHASRSGVRVEARDLYLLLARRAHERHSYVEGDLLYSDVLEHADPSDDSVRIAALRGRAMMRYRQGRFDGALEDYAGARTIAQRLGDVATQAEILLDEATCLDWIDEYRRSLELVEQARSLAPEHSPLLGARIVHGLGRAAFHFGRLDEAVELLGRAGALAERLGDEGWETLIAAWVLQAGLLPSQGRFDESERLFARLIPLCEHRLDRQHLGVCFNNRIELWIARNEKDRLFEDLGRLLEIARELANLRLEREAHFYLALYRYYLGDLAEAEKHAARSVELDQQRSDRIPAEALLLLARVLAARGEGLRARAVLGEIHRRQQEMRDRGDPDADLRPGDKVYHDLVEHVTGDAQAARWDDLEQRAEQSLPAAGVIEVFLFEARAWADQADAARRALERAHAAAEHFPLLKSLVELELNRVGARA
jgi:tetratricopeptide (TPR) repeat protein